MHSLQLLVIVQVMGQPVMDFIKQELFVEFLCQLYSVKEPQPSIQGLRHNTGASSFSASQTSWVTGNYSSSYHQTRLKMALTGLHLDIAPHSWILTTAHCPRLSAADRPAAVNIPVIMDAANASGAAAQ